MKGQGQGEKSVVRLECGGGGVGGRSAECMRVERTRRNRMHAKPRRKRKRKRQKPWTEQKTNFNSYRNSATSNSIAPTSQVKFYSRATLHTNKKIAPL